MKGEKGKVVFLIISIIIVSNLFLSNVSCLEEYKTFEVEKVYRIEFNNGNDLNFILIPTGDFGRNDSQETYITIQFEEVNITIYEKYTNGTFNLPHSSTERIIDGTGTPWINVSFTAFELETCEEITFQIRVKRFRSKATYFEKSVNKSKWLQPTKYVDSNHSIIIEKASELTSPNQSIRTKILKILEYVKNDVRYNESYAASNHWIDNSTYYGEENGRASDVLRIEQGVCIHFARLFAALCRASDIPSRIVYGYHANYNQLWNRFNIVGHAWVEYHDLNVWHFVEPRNRILDNQPAQYIPLISGPMQEDSYYIESKYPDTYVLDYVWDDDTHIYENTYYKDHEMLDIVILEDENQGWLLFLLFCFLILILLKLLRK